MVGVKVTMRIETDRLIIRDMEPEDENAYIAMASDGSLDEDIFCGCGSNYHEWMPSWIKGTILLNEEDNPKKDYLAYTIVEKQQGTIIGSVGCSYFDDLDKVGLVYFIGAEHRGDGYAAEAVVAYTNYFFERYNIPKIIANIRTENKASCITADRAGFKLVETKMYKDYGDAEEELYNFYEMTKNS